MTMQEIIQNLNDIKDYYTDDKDFSYYGDEYHGLTAEQKEAIEEVIDFLVVFE